MRAVSKVRLGAALGAMAVLAAACGSGSQGSSASAPGSGRAAPATPAVTVQTHGSGTGSFLTDGSGRALYLFGADHGSTSSCSGACLSAWPALASKGSVSVSGSVLRSRLGTITRSDGTRQITYAGHPLYHFAGDSGPGQTDGQGSSAFGAKWWLVAPSGQELTTTTTTTAPSPSSSGYGGY